MDSTGNNVLNVSVEAEEDDEEPMTSVEALAALEEAWLNEELSPELLHHRTELIECMQAQVLQMEQNIARLKKGDLLISVHKMEIDRVNYIIKSYLKCRLQKIEQYGAHILSKETEQNERDARFSPAELKFSQDHLKSVLDHLRLLALQHFPTIVQEFDAAKTMPTHKLDSYVFLKMNQTVPGLSMIDESVEGGTVVIDLEKDTQHIMRYKSISDLIKSGEASLI